MRKDKENVRSGKDEKKSRHEEKRHRDKKGTDFNNPKRRKF